MSARQLSGAHGSLPNNTFGKDQVIVRTPSRNYTAYDAAQLLIDLGFGHRLEALRAVQVHDKPLPFVHLVLPSCMQAGKDLQDFQHPGVDTLVVYGYNVSTPGELISMACPTAL